MASNYNDITPAAPAGSFNVKWQTDGSGNDSAYVLGTLLTVPVGFYNFGVGQNNDVYFYGIYPIALVFPASATGATAKALTAATGSTTFTFKKNTVAFATCVFSGAGTTGAYTQASPATFNGTSDILEIDGPATADATLATFSLILLGARS